VQEHSFRVDGVAHLHRQIDVVVICEDVLALVFAEEERRGYLPTDF